MTKQERIIFAITAETIQEFCESNYNRRLTEEEMKEVEDALYGIEYGDLILDALETAAPCFIASGIPIMKRRIPSQHALDEGKSTLPPKLPPLKLRKHPPAA